MNIVITAGGLSEHIDNVRKITNSSTGKLGLLIAEEFLKYDNIDNIYYICPRKTFKPNNKKVNIIEVDGAYDTKSTIEKILKNNNIDIFIHSMAITDYTVDYVTSQYYLNEIYDKSKSIYEMFDKAKKYTDTKIASNIDNLILVLKPTPKIISIIKRISPKTTLVGFKLLDDVEESELIKVATKLKDKNKCDYVIANDLANIKNGNHKVLLIDSLDNIDTIYGKENISKKLVKRLIQDKHI